MPEFEVEFTQTVTYEGAITVVADDEDDAENMVLAMNIDELVKDADVLDSDLLINEINPC